MKLVAGVIAVAAIASIGLSLLHPFGNPRVESPKGLDTLLQGANIPRGAKDILISKCADCHSDETQWPAYARVAPGSWLMERDIIEARKQLNLSIWEQLPGDTQYVLIGKIVHEAKSGDMPPAQYRALHWGAKLTPADVAALSQLSNSAEDETSVSGPGDATRGKLIFEKRCTGCHAMQGDREGPGLARVFGRKAGGVAGFDYSESLKNSAIIWNDSTLEKWLKDPEALIPGTTMDFHVPNPQERSDLIAYFKQ